MLWHHMLSRDVLEACETKITHGWEVDALLESNGGPASRLHVAEVLSRAAAAHGVHLPMTDGALAFRVRFNDVPTTDRTGGTLLLTTDGRVGYSLGDGRVVESTGRGLSIIKDPGDRYVAAYRVPGFTHH